MAAVEHDEKEYDVTIRFAKPKNNLTAQNSEYLELHEKAQY